MQMKSKHMPLFYVNVRYTHRVLSLRKESFQTCLSKSEIVSLQKNNLIEVECSDDHETCEISVRTMHSFEDFVIMETV